LEQLKARYAEELEGYKDSLERSKELLKAQIDRSVFVTRAHFETELDAYKKIFEDLAAVRLLMPVMHPTLRVVSEGETRAERVKELVTNLGQLAVAHDKAVRTLENLGPFCTQEIFGKLNACLHVVRAEILHLQTGGEDTFSVDWNRRGEQRVDDFLKAYNETSNAVRLRIATLAILPSP
jgi:hypothetical protein